MRSIAVTKPDMGVLPRERLPLSPFGVLAQAFAEELLARAEREEANWPHVPLDLLEEGEESPPPVAPAKFTLQVDLKLVMEALRREENRTEQHLAAERIVERVLQMQGQRERSHLRTDRLVHTDPRPLTVQQEFHQHLTQNIHISPTLPAGTAPQGRRAPGALARQAEDFSRRLQTLREEGKAFRRETGLARGRGMVLPDEAAAVPAAPQAASMGGAGDPPPPETLALLEDQGGQAALAAEIAGTAALLRSGQQLGQLLEESFRARPVQSAAPQGPVMALPEEIRQTDGETAAPRSTGEAPSSSTLPRTRGTRPGQPAAEVSDARPAGEAGRAAPAGEPRSASVPWTQPPAARDIRVSPEGSAPGKEPQASGEAGPVIQPPELSHRTEPEVVAPGEGQHRTRHTDWQSAPDKEAAPAQAVRMVQKREDAPAGRRAPDVAGGPDKEVRGVPVPWTRPPWAREIRVGPEGSAPGKEPQASGEGGPVIQLPELSHRTEPEVVAPGEGQHRTRHTDWQSAPGKEAAPAQTVREQGEVLASRQAPRGGAVSEKDPRKTAAPWTQPPAARDIRVGPEGGAPGKEPQTNREGEAGIKPPAARDIRVDPEGGAPGKEPHASGETAPLIQPPELSHRMDPEGAAPVRGQRGEREMNRQSTPGKEEAPAQTSRTARERREASISRQAPREGAVPAGEPQSTSIPWTQPPAARDIRVGPEGSASGKEPQTAREEGPVIQPPELSFRAGPESEGPRASKSVRNIQGAAAPLTHEVGETIAAPRTPLTAARDIRMGPRGGYGGTAPSMWAEQTEAGDIEWAPPIEMALDRPAGPERSPAASQTGAPQAGPENPARRQDVRSPLREPEPVSLTYGPARQTGESARPQAEESEYVRSLPDWARRFLREGASGPRTMGVARDIASLPRETEEDTVQWTAPAYRPPEAPITHREKGKEDRARRSGEVRISDAEIQRTADKVYRMIEERIRRERRRLGF